jgi:hypothetical protein
MEEINGDQVVDFEVHEQVLNNLSPKEKILYKLKVAKPPVISKYSKTFIKVSPFIHLKYSKRYIKIHPLEE